MPRFSMIYLSFINLFQFYWVVVWRHMLWLILLLPCHTYKELSLFVQWDNAARSIYSPQILLTTLSQEWRKVDFQKEAFVFCVLSNSHQSPGNFGNDQMGLGCFHQPAPVLGVRAIIDQLWFPHWLPQNQCFKSMRSFSIGQGFTFIFRSQDLKLSLPSQAWLRPGMERWLFACLIRTAWLYNA